QLESRADLNGHCTGSIRLLPDNSDVFISQVTWSSYVTMLRINKSYDLQFNGAHFLAKEVVLSSYPGMLFSVDDFYETDAGITIMETTVHIWNTELYDMFITPESVPTWI
ncbi:phospholipase B-like protein, partial [Kipferlia bialata]